MTVNKKRLMQMHQLFFVSRGGSQEHFATVSSLELRTAIGALFDLVINFRITIRAHHHFLFLIHHQTALGAFSRSFGNGRRTRRAYALEFLFFVSK